MKKYQDLSIDQKINFKANMKAKGEAYGTLPNNWYPMTTPIVSMFHGNVYAYDALYNYGKKYKAGYQIK